MKNKFAFLIFLLLACALGVQAQTPMTKVDLKSGSILLGELVSYDPNTILVLRVNGNELTFSSSDVKKVVMKDMVIKSDTKFEHVSKWYHNAKFALMAGESGTGFSITYALQRLVLPGLLVGLGSGYENYYGESSRNIVPLFAEAKYYILENKVSPFISMRYGYAWADVAANSGVQIAQGGINYNLNIGMRIAVHKIQTEMFIGIKRQKMYYESFDGFQRSKYDIFAKRLETGIGIVF